MFVVRYPSCARPTCTWPVFLITALTFQVWKICAWTLNLCWVWRLRFTGEYVGVLLLLSWWWSSSSILLLQLNNYYSAGHMYIRMVLTVSPGSYFFCAYLLCLGTNLFFFSVAGAILQYFGIALIPIFMLATLWKYKSDTFVEVS